MEDTSHFLVITRSESRIEGRDKVTGAARYAADFPHDGALEVAFTSSPVPHAVIRSIDTTRAIRMPGVRAVLTGEDVRPTRLGRRLLDWPVLAWDKVLMVGDRVAAVAADTMAQARAAAAAVVVDYEELTPIFDIDSALDADAPVLHSEADTYQYLGGVRPPRDHPNLQGERVHEHGDPDVAFASASHVFDHTFEVSRTLAGSLEPRASLVWMEGDRFHVLTTNKSPFRLRDQMAAALDLQPVSLTIHNGHIGGDFGGKGISVEEHALLLMTKATGRPVRTVSDFASDAGTNNTRHGGRLRLRTALDASGRILGHEAWVTLDGGAYAAAKPNADLVPAKANFTLPCYDVPAARVTARTVYTNTVPGGNARSPGQPQTSFAAESHVDMMAEALGMNPFEFRLRNAIRDGGIDVLGNRWGRSMVVPMLEEMRRTSEQNPTGPGQGRGIAISTRASASGNATVRLTVTPTGGIEIGTGVTDQGGGAHTVLQRIVAEEMRIDPALVTVRSGSTEDVPYDQGVGGSRVTPVVGGAAQEGARLLRDQVERLYPNLSASEQLKAAGASGSVSVDGIFTHPPGTYSCAGYVVDVVVDADTGEVEVVDCVLVADVGTLINPVAARGQLIGGFATGLGQALMEEVMIEDGTVTNPNLDGYKIPSVRDMPPITVILLEDDRGPGPYGAKSVGELTNSAVAPAVANAIASAGGPRVISLPISAEKIYGQLGMLRGAPRQRPGP